MSERKMPHPRRRAATCEELTAAVAPLATKTELAAAVAPLATQEELKTEVGRLAGAIIRLDERVTRLNQSLTQSIQDLRDDVLTRMDAMIATWQTTWNKQTLQDERHREAETRLDDHEKRIQKLEGTPKP